MLEARGRVGGRTEGGATADGTPVELGGQWLGPTQTRMYALVEELGLETFPTYNTGQHVVQLGGKQSRMASKRGAVPKLSPFVLADLFQGMTRFKRLADKVPLDRPWTAPGAKALDNQTFETWIVRNLRTADRADLLPGGHRGGLLGGERQPLRPPRPLLRPLRHRPRGAAEHRPGRPAGPHRGRIDPGERVHGGGPRRSGHPRQPGAPHRAGRGPGGR